MIKSLINRFKNTRSFKHFYTDWITTLKTTLLPHLTRSLSDTFATSEHLLLSTHVELLLSHFNTLFSALDSVSNDDVSYLIYPPWRNDIEKPFLWFGDFHPYMFTNLLRSFLDNDDSDNDGYEPDCSGFSSAWRNLDGSLGRKVEHIECGLRLIVPAIAKRAREAQGKLVAKMGASWTVKRDGEVLDCGEIVGEVVEELTCVFLDANRLRRSVVYDIVAVLNVNQAAFFLHGLAQFYVGFWEDKLVDRFHKSASLLG